MGNSEYDTKLLIGQATAAAERGVYGSYNDLFSRPLAVVGNTGSGKSCTIAHLLQQAFKLHDPAAKRPRIFILDINGEYGKAFGVKVKGGRQPNRLYVNSEEASIPLWLMNAFEVCQWLSAAEQTQQPALTNFWALAKGANASGARGNSDIRAALIQFGTIVGVLSDETVRKKGASCKECWEAIKQYVPWLISDASSKNDAAKIEAVLRDAKLNSWEPYDRSFGEHDKTIRDSANVLLEIVEKRLGGEKATIEQTADKPVFFPVTKLDNPSNLESAAELSPGDRSIRQFLQGLQLRIQNRRTDRRWHAFYNFSELRIESAEAWLRQFGIGSSAAAEVCVIDCSMLAHDVLPYACGIIGRMFLELREQVRAEERFHEPWVIVLEEAHNYVKPRRQDEERGVVVSREAYERIAKEGRKFGLSLIVASQRPSDVSPTVLSQCANFITHRLQNPDDIEHFRKIVPSQSRRLLDQITILRAGEGIVVGSGFNVPTRVQVRKPVPEPASESSRPYVAWKKGAAEFGLSEALHTWGVSDGEAESTAAEPE